MTARYVTAAIAVFVVLWLTAHTVIAVAAATSGSP